MVSYSSVAFALARLNPDLFAHLLLLKTEWSVSIVVWQSIPCVALIIRRVYLAFNRMHLTLDRFTVHWLLDVGKQTFPLHCSLAELILKVTKCTIQDLLAETHI